MSATCCCSVRSPRRFAPHSAASSTKRCEHRTAGRVVAELGARTYGRRYALASSGAAAAVVGPRCAVLRTENVLTDSSGSLDVWTPGDVVSACLRLAEAGQRADAHRRRTLGEQMARVRIDMEQKRRNLSWHLVGLLSWQWPCGIGPRPGEAMAWVGPLAECATADLGLHDGRAPMGADGGELLGDRIRAREITSGHWQPPTRSTSTGGGAASLALSQLLESDATEPNFDARNLLERAIEELTEMHMPPALARARRTRTSRRSEPRPVGLTARELEVLRLLAPTGRSNKEIAVALVVSPRTVSSTDTAIAHLCQDRRSRVPRRWHTR